MGYQVSFEDALHYRFYFDSLDEADQEIMMRPYEVHGKSLRSAFFTRLFENDDQTLAEKARILYEQNRITRKVSGR